jgi:diaminohydroxyphosphoribosylaminopyrimidine deaminase/5-amino-6-(5-phosphoribosylamino)uracil reductase
MHKQFLLAALEQALPGRGICAPNPCVGAVAVQHGKIIAQSWHRGAGTSHAEVLLLDSLPEKSSDVTLYVTLEPCNHWGRTPPCVDAIIRYGIKRVVYAYSDPNPVVSRNNTPALLKKAGIDVLHYPLPEIDQFYQSYRHWVLEHKPWVTAKIAQTFDGKIGVATGAREILSNSLCAGFTHKNRLNSDVILTTARTVNADDPLLNVRLPDRECVRPIAIIDSKLTMNPGARVLTQGAHCHVYHEAGYSVKKPHANCSYHPIPVHNHRLDLSAVIQHLGDLGYHDVWVEAGGELFNSLHQAGLVNRTYVYLVPKVSGENAVSAWGNANIFNRPHSVFWQAMEDNMIARFEWF